MRGVVIAAPGSGHGKTTVTLGLLRALRDHGVHVASGKSGPDYIDPGFHAIATGHPCVTLDAWALTSEALRAQAHMLAECNATSPSEMMIIEGAMGAFDGATSDEAVGKGSAADLAAALGVSMILVVDVSHVGQTAGAIVHGVAAWAEKVGTKVSAVILNRVASPRHLTMTRRAVEATCPVVGAVPRDTMLSTPSRHLGLVQAEELEDVETLIARTSKVVAEACDLQAIQGTTESIDVGARTPIRPLGQRIAVAKDEAFSFAYWHILQDWRNQGAEIAEFSPLADQAPWVEADALFLPGGYPELHAGQLAASERFQDGMRAAAARGALIYGECGGYMVLGDGLVDADGTRHSMLGLLRLETSFAKRSLHLGYRSIEVADGPWQGPAKGHEFHYAMTLKADGKPFAEAADATGASLGPIGLREGKVMGSFGHIIHTDAV